ncbi:T9SS type A sorting domain-containing protein [Neolewinella litorea]|uniref:T9SS type A sorting domain-containing protein n=1 Tax=Neolewinella litorea TaxID=2562452 RepID=A0A4S4NQP5_9BACT|nr:T9SS type A sorting domain-containing protein [Neolewinella litorea]THH40701.1 T9SS type A sorting domain-containing protein [Neolewinella litorea]
MKNTLPTLLFLSLFTSWLPAQSYIFTTAQEEYTELTGGDLISGDSIWDDPDFRVPLGFTFPLFGAPLDTLYFNAEEGLGGDLTTEYTDPDGNYTDSSHHLLYAYITDLADRGLAHLDSAESPITYHITGTGPNRIGILQWKNAGFYDEIAEDDESDYFVNFQLWLYEGSGRIEVHYGPSSQEVLDGEAGTQPGFALFKNFYFPTDDDTLGFDEGYFLRGPADDPEFVSFDQLGEDELPLLDNGPEPGMVFIFSVSETTALPATDAVAAAFEIYPNPATEGFHIAMAPTFTDRVDRLEVFDLSGRLLTTYAGIPTEVKLAAFRSGIYHVRLTTDSGSSAHARLIKR